MVVLKNPLVRDGFKSYSYPYELVIPGTEDVPLRLGYISRPPIPTEIKLYLPPRRAQAKQAHRHHFLSLTQ